MNSAYKISLLSGMLLCNASAKAQVLNVAIQNTGSNNLVVTGTATAPGFSTAAYTSWGAMNITFRLPKSVTVSPAPAVVPPAATAAITNESTAFTGAAPGNAFNPASTDLSMFDLTSFGQADDGYWYFQIAQSSTGGNESIPVGSSVTIYQFTLPATWSCNSCMEIVTSQIPGLPINTLPFIDNSGTGGNVMSNAIVVSPLPVNFKDFTVTANKCDAVLTWETGGEKDAVAFRIEQSADGQNFTVLESLPAKGTADAYSYTAQDGTGKYYRIKMIKLDNSWLQSTVRFLPHSTNCGSILFTVTPNPATTVADVRVSVVNDINGVLMQLTDAAGRLITEQHADLKKGDNTMQVDMSKCVPGIYYLLLKGNGIEESAKVMKMN